MADVERSLTTIDAAIRKINSSCNVAAKQANLLNQQLQLDPKNSQLLAENYNVLSREVEATTAKIALLQERQQSMAAQGKNGTDEYQKYSTDIIIAKENLEKLIEKQKEAKDTTAESITAQEEASAKLKTADDEAIAKMQEYKDANEQAQKAAQEESEKTKEKHDELKASINSAALAMAALGIAAIGAMRGVYSAINAASTASENILSAQSLYKIDPEEYQQNANIWYKATNDASAYFNALQQMQEQIALAGKNTNQTRLALERLGLTCKDISNLNTDEALALISSKLMEIKDPAERANAAVQLLHNSGTELAAVLGTDTATIEEWKSANSENIVSDESIASAKEMKSELIEFNNKLNAIKITLGTALIPLLQSFTRIINSVLPIFKSISSFLGGMSDTMSDIVTWIAIITASMIGLAAVIKMVNLVMNANPIFRIVAAVAALLDLIIALYEILHKNVDRNYTEMSYAAGYAADTANKTAETVNKYSTVSTTTNNSKTSTINIDKVEINEGASDTDSLIRSINQKALQNV